MGVVAKRAERCGDHALPIAFVGHTGCVIGAETAFSFCHKHILAAQLNATGHAFGGVVHQRGHHGISQFSIAIQVVLLGC